MKAFGFWNVLYDCVLLFKKTIRKNVLLLLIIFGIYRPTDQKGKSQRVLKWSRKASILPELSIRLFSLKTRIWSKMNQLLWKIAPSKIYFGIIVLKYDFLRSGGGIWWSAPNASLSIYAQDFRQCTVTLCHFNFKWFLVISQTM